MNQPPATSHQPPGPALATGGAPVQQCRTCLRYFVEGELVALSFGAQAAAQLGGRIGHDYECGRPECAGIAQLRRENESAELRRYSRPPVRRASASHRDRREAKKICHSSLVTRHSSLDEARKPYKDDDGPDEPATSHQPPGTQLSALDFETSANARLLEFFDRPENQNCWFSAKWLEDEVGQTSGRMNNRAIWLREKFNPIGLELDWHGCPPGENLPAGSYYRLCPLATALRLTDDQKRKLLAVLPGNAELSHGGDEKQ